MRKVMQIFRIRKVGSLLLVLLALVAVFPVFFSVTGSLMGQKELNDLLGAVLTADQWICFRSGSQLCILESTSALSDAEILCESPAGFSGVFCDVLEFRKDYCRSSGRIQIPGGSTGSVGICQISFSGKKSAVYDLCGIDDDALSGNDAQ